MFDWANERESSFKAASRGPYHLIFSPDGRRLAGVENHSALIWDVADLVHRPLAKLDSVKSEDLDAWCARLNSADGKSAYQAVWKLIEGDPGGAQLKAQVAPASLVTSKNITRWISELDSLQFASRDKAEKELLNLGDDALVLIKAALKNVKSLEQGQRLQPLSDRINEGHVTTQKLRELRTIMALEQIGTPTARRGPCMVDRGGCQRVVDSTCTLGPEPPGHQKGKHVAARNDGSCDPRFDQPAP